MGAQLFDWLKQAALDTAGYELWVRVGGLVVTAGLYAWARYRGAGKHVLSFLAGALSSVVVLLAITVLLVGLGPKALIVTVALLAGASLAYRVTRVRQRESARLGQHQKGYFDYERDLKRASTTFLGGLTIIAKIMVQLTKKMNRFTEQIQNSKTNSDRERVANRAAKMFRKAAISYRNCAAQVDQSTHAIATASAGLLDCLQAIDNPAAMATMAMNRAALGVLGERIALARASTDGFRQVLAGSPRVTQRLNAAQHELGQCLDMSLGSMDFLATFVNNAIVILDRRLSRQGT